MGKVLLRFLATAESLPVQVDTLGTNEKLVSEFSPCIASNSLNDALSKDLLYAGNNLLKLYFIEKPKNFCY